MPQVAAAAVVIFQSAAAIATTVGTAMGFSGLVATAAGAISIAQSTMQAWSVISSAISPKPKVNSSQTQLQTKAGAVSPRAIIMGRTAVAGTLLTPTPLQSGRGNALATNFYALSHCGPSGVVESVLWGDDVVTFDAQGQAIGKYANNMWLFQKNGSWSQTAISFIGTPGIGADTPTQWDSTKRAQGCLVVALVVRYAASVLANNSQTPIFVVDANAVELTDPRTGGLATTQAQRRNPAVWAYSWRLGWFQNNRRVIGLGQPASEIHAAAYAYAANVADANGWTISGEASTADDRYAVEMAMLQVCASSPVERNGLQSVITSALRSVVGTIKSDDLRANPKWRYQVEQSSRPTAIQTRFRSESNRWQMVEGAEVTDASWLAEDAGREKGVSIEYAYAGGGSAHVGHLAALDATNGREPIIFSLPCKQQARYIGFVGDAVNIQMPEIGLSSLKATIIQKITNSDGTVDYDLLTETDTKYPFAAGKTSAAPSFTLQPGFNIYSVPQPDLADWSAVAAQITSGATSLPIVRVTGSASNYNFASGVVFKIRLNAVGSPWLVSEEAPPNTSQHEFRGLTNNTGYIVGVAYRGITGVEGPVRELPAVGTGTLTAGDLFLIVNQVRDAGLNRQLRYRSLTWDTVPSPPTLTYHTDDASVQRYIRMTTPAVAALGSGNFYGTVMAKAQTYAESAKLQAGRIAYAVKLNVLSPPSWQRVWVRCMLWNNAGVWFDSREADYNLANGYSQNVGGFFDTSNALGCTLVVWGQLKNTVNTAQIINLWQPIITNVLPGQTTLPEFSIGVDSDAGADVTVESVRVITPQFPVIEIKQGEAGHTGNRTVTHTVSIGGVAATGGTFSLPSVNLGSASATVNSSSGTVTLSGIVQSGAYVIRYTHTDGVQTDLPVNVTYVPVVSGTTDAGKVAQTNNGMLANNNWQTIASVTLPNCPTGLLSFDSSFFSPTGWAGGDFSVEARITINGVLAGSVQAAQAVVSGGIIQLVDLSTLFSQFVSVTSGSRTVDFQLRRTIGSGYLTSSDTIFAVDARPT